MLTDDEAAELAALRARAYGPDADLREDPVAIARLDRLEAAARAGVPQASADPVPEDDSARTDRDARVEPAPASDAGLEPHEPVTAADATPRRPRRGRPALLVGAGALIAGIVVGYVAGAASGRVGAASAPSPAPTMGEQYVSSWRAVSERYPWDAGSPRLLADIQGAYVWGGRTAAGTMTCAVVDDGGGLVRNCAPTESLTVDGVGIGVAGSAGDYREFMIRPDGDPLVWYQVISGQTGEPLVDPSGSQPRMRFLD